MLLCRKDGLWYVGIRRDAGTFAFTLVAARHMPKEEGFSEARAAWWGKTLPTVDGVEFFPVLHFRGMRVRPRGWNGDSAAPLLECHAAFDRHPSGASEWEALRRVLHGARWECNPREGECWGYVPVEELTKEAGPPPPDGMPF